MGFAIGKLSSFLVVYLKHVEWEFVLLSLCEQNNENLALLFFHERFECCNFANYARLWVVVEGIAISLCLSSVLIHSSNIWTIIVRLFSTVVCDSVFENFDALQLCMLVLGCQAYVHVC